MYTPMGWSRSAFETAKDYLQKGHKHMVIHMGINIVFRMRYTEDAHLYSKQSAGGLLDGLYIYTAFLMDQR